MWKLLPKTRKSHPLSKLLRPFFEAKKSKRQLGSFLLVLVVITSLLVAPASAFEAYPTDELVALEAEVATETQKRNKAPLEKFTISQGFWVLHPALDLSAPQGTPVYAIEAGKVAKTEFSYWGYGNQVLVDHANGLQSRYAHLSQITVQEGQEVNQETVIGLVGATGLATGRHLHLEIIDQGRLINPQVYLGL